MRYEYKTSFAQTVKRLPQAEKVKIKEAARELVVFFETRQKTKGLGLKKLKGDFWELRVDLKNRIIFRFKDDLVEFVIAGSHDKIKRYLGEV
ncbi:MAG: hypothetical protein ABH836_07965 [Candidatus Omnitrophota bacterium]